MHVLKHAQRSNGHVHVAVDLACTQADSGHEVVFASARGSYDDLLRAHGVRVTDVTEPVSLGAALRSAWDLLRLAWRTKPDVIHAHMMSSAVLAYVVSKLTSAQLVTTVHNSFDRHSGLMRLGTLVVAVSEAERDHLIGRGFPADRTVTILNGSDASPREALPLDDIGGLDEPCIVTLSGLHHRKAVHDVIRAFALVRPEFPDWHLNIIGGGPDRARLERLVEELDLGTSVRFLGTTLTPRYLLESADVFASASLAEPFGLTIAEARAAGCAVVATAVGGVPEVLDHGRAGLLVPPSEPGAMADAFRTLLGDPGALEQWQHRARKDSERFRVHRVAEEYEHAYRTMLQRRRFGGASRMRPTLAASRASRSAEHAPRRSGGMP